MQGLLDTDGCVRLKKYNNSMSISYASVNLDLIKNVQRLCYSLGLTANIIKKERIRKKYYKGKDYCEIYYELAITAPASLRQNLFSLPRKQDITKQSNIVTRGWGTTVAITNIEKLNYKVEMVCIYVDNPDHLYLTNDFIVTHNTMLLVSSAISLLKNGYYDKIIWIRNNIDVKDTKDMGALPGEAIEKLLPYLGPFVDHVGEDEVKCMINNGSLLVEPLQFLRGRNFERAIIMCSEAENLTREHIQLIIARAASESILMFDADTRQRDRSIFDTSKGIERMIESLVGEHLFGYVHLTKSERSETAALADKIK